MLCSKCQTENGTGNNFCVKCGAPLKKEEEIKKSQEKIEYKNKIIDDLKFLGQSFLKPIKTVEKEKEKFNDPKNAFILAGIVTLATTIFYLLKTMIGSLFGQNIFGKSTFAFSNLGNVKYLKTIGTGIIISIGFILLVAAVYYMACLILKKDKKFSEFLLIGVVSSLPLMASLCIVSPILGTIWYPLGIVALIVSLIYSFMIIVHHTNKLVGFKNDDRKIYFQLVCLSIIAVIFYFVYVNLMLSSFVNAVQNNLNDILNGLF